MSLRRREDEIDRAPKDRRVRAVKAGIAAMSTATLLAMALPVQAATTDGSGGSDRSRGLAQADASALGITLAGTPLVSTGTTSARDSGSGEEVTGQVLPPLDVLGAQGILPVSLLVQDALAEVDSNRALSAACAGVAGEGASVIGIGDAGCIEPGADVLGLLTSLDLTALQISDVSDTVDSLLTDVLGDLLGNLGNTPTPGGGTLDDVTGGAVGDLGGGLGGVVDDVVDGVVDSVVDGVLDPVTDPLQAVLDQVTTPVQAVVDQLEASLPELGLGLRLRAVEASCTADGTRADGASTLTDAGVVLAGGPAGELTLVDLPVLPAPNTDVVVDLDEVVTDLLDGLRTDLENSLGGVAADLTLLTDALQAQIVDTVLAQVAPQLAPLSENVLRLTLNRQTTPESGALEVTALSAEVLPAAAALGGPSNLAAVTIGTVACGPNERAGAPVVEEPEEPEGPTDPQTPGTPSDPTDPTDPGAPQGGPGDVPTAVDAGVGTVPTSGPVTGAAAVLLALAAGAAGLLARLRRRDQLAAGR
ncbi:hypothetical protein KLP28_06115 [Nocardioidaceae bacterium]|nr:hypothetical protein KLP28_06115 [Nocardioidaceae bacterium]